MKNQRICNQKENMKGCTCTYPNCPRKGICCECIRYHRKMNQVPGCLFPQDSEKSYDRSIENFIKVWNKKLNT
ncbi:cytosolic protein [Candidatus Dojkabacteria bacterium]|nr:cytosolic protein [Candidatus Dojkabacteria bacterium]